jgi:uncharacterized protein (TIGR00730 family)
MSQIRAAEEEETDYKGQQRNRGDDQERSQEIPPGRLPGFCISSRTRPGNAPNSNGPHHLMHTPYRNKDIGEASICVFCGSARGNDPLYVEGARALGAAIGAHGFRMIFGAGNVGLMGETARAASEAGAPVIGVLPQYLRHVEPPLKSAQETIITPNIQERKQRMIALSDAFVLLPGGLGTLDEFFEVLTEAQLGVHSKPIVVINLKGYFNPLQAMLDHTIEKGFASEAVLTHFRFAASVEGAMDIVVAMLKARVRPPIV